MSSMADMSAYPIIRLDQIPLLDDSTLKSAQKDALELSATLRAEDPSSKLLFFLHKQLDAMKSEEGNRAAQFRVHNLLAGIEDALSSTTAQRETTSFLTPRIAASVEDGLRKSSSAPSKSDIKTKVSDVYIPVRDRRSKISANTVSTSREISKLDTLSESLNLIEANVLEVGSASEAPSSSTSVNSTPIAFSATKTLDAFQSVVNRDKKILENDSMIKQQRQRKVLIEKFGQEFVVESAHKKIRFFPTKKSQQLPPEVIIAQERDKRRAAAMDRLMARQQERIVVKHQRVKKIRTKENKQSQGVILRPIATSKPPNEIVSDDLNNDDDCDDDDSEESISGGEEDPCITEQFRAQPSPVEVKLQTNEVASEAKAEKVENLRSHPVVRDPTKLETKPAKVLIDGLIYHNAVSLRIDKKDASQRDLQTVKSTRETSRSSFAKEEFSLLSKESSEFSGPKESIKSIAVVHDAGEHSATNENSMGVIKTKDKKEVEVSIENIQESFDTSEIVSDMTIDDSVQLKCTAALDAIRMMKLNKISTSSEPNQIISSPDVERVSEIVLENLAFSGMKGTNASVETSVYLLSSSRLIEIKNDESEIVLTCRIGVDSIPGLSSWRLVAVDDVKSDPTWEYNIDFEGGSLSARAVQDESTTRLFSRRSTMRKRIPCGLVVLLVEMEEFLLKTSDSESSYTDVVKYWKETIKLFDRRAVSNFYRFPQNVVPEASQDEGNLFYNVSVCGNCYAACSKLERILRLFTGSDDLSRNKKIADTVVLEAIKERGLIDDIDVLVDLPIDHLAELLRLPESSLLNVNIKTLLESDLRVNPKNFAVKLENKSEKNIQNIIARFVRDENDDFDDFIEPVYNKDVDIKLSLECSNELLTETLISKNIEGNNVASIVEIKERDPENVEHFDNIDDAEVHGDDDDFVIDDDDFIEPAYALDGANSRSLTDHISITELVTENREDIGIVSPIQNNHFSSVSSERIQLSDYYNNIAMIFPFAYGASGDVRGLDYVSSGKLLVEGMHLQVKQYEEWLQIMKDYSTVFSKGKETSVSCAIDNVIEGSVQNKFYNGKPNSLHYRVTSSRTDVLDIINDAFEDLSEWEELPSGLGLGVTWNFLWTWSRPKLNVNHLLVWQRVNHFADSKQLTRKDLLKRNLQRFTDMSGKVAANFEIMPQTFVLPHEYTSFVRAFTEGEVQKDTVQDLSNSSEYKQRNEHNLWIMKPVGLSRGRGISIVSDLGGLSFSQTSVIQKYVERPLCLDGYKFDLRLYVLVTSFHPLEAFIYKEGFARVSTQKYSLDSSDTKNLFIHLTNSSIQKHNPQGPSADNPLLKSGVDAGGSKISLGGENGLWHRLLKFGRNPEDIWREISLLVMKSLVAVDMQMTYQPCSFEVFGYDILLDENLRPWLLEVNASPSLARENPLDNRVKDAMIQDTVKLIDPAPFDRKALLVILKRRLQEISQKVYPGKHDLALEKDLRSILGDYVPRRYGEVPKYLGNYEMLCPGTKLYSHVVKLKAKIIKEDFSGFASK